MSPSTTAPEARPRTAGEAARLEVLQQHRILGTAPEAAFERAVALAARLFKTPLAYVSLVDEHRQWYKACFGAHLQHTAHSFCAHAVAAQAVLVVPDATLDRRFKESPLVAGPPHLRFYAGAPLVVPGGHALGTLCVLDTVPRADLSPDERDTLRDLAAGVVSELELRRILAEQDHGKALNAAILASALDSVITMDSAGRVTEWNPAAERTFGYTRAEANGRELATLIVPERLQEAHRRGLAHYMRSGEGPVLGRRIEVPAVRKDGDEFSCELAITPFVLDGEQLFTAQLRDLTERKAAEQALTTSHNLLRAVVDGVPQVIFSTLR